MTTDIEVTDLVKTYPNGVRALRGLSFQAEAGTVFGLLGPNGAGKSTTVRILTTLSRPDGGTARVAGVDVVREPRAVRHAIGAVGQKSSCDLEATGRENLALQGILYGMRRADIADRSSELLTRFGLGDAAGRPTRTWSGGMQRKLEVAMGLIHRPRVLFLDEPTTGLDPQSRSEMWALIADLAHDDGMTVLLTTHYLDEADHLADLISIVTDGTVVAHGSPESLKAQMHGDAITIELHSPFVDNGVRAAVSALPLREVQIDGALLRARTADGAAVLPAILAALQDAGVSPASATVSRPSLDDVYLQHTGRAYASGEAPR